MKLHGALALVLFPCIASFAEGVHGTVTDGVSGAHVAGAEIVVRRQRTEPGRTHELHETWHALSDSDGAFTVPEVPEELVTDRRNQFLIVARSGDLVGQGVCAYRGDMGVRAAEIFVWEVGSINGRVVDAGGNGVPDVWLTPQLVDGTREKFASEILLRVHTDERGNFQLNELILGEWEVRVQPQAHASLDAGPFSAGARDVVIELENGGSAAGVVVTALDGAPVPHVEVHAAGSNGLTRSAMTDEQGRFMVENLQDGDFQLKFQEAAYSLIGNEPEFTVAGASHVDGLTVTVARGATVSGHVYDRQSKAPLEGVVVNAGQSSATTDSEGAYRLDGVTPGRNLIRRQPFQGYQNRRDREAVEIFVEAGSTVAGIDLHLEPGLTIRGVVRDAGGKPILGARVRSRSFEHDADAASQSGEDGSFEHHGFPPAADVFIEAEADGYVQAGPTRLRLASEDAADVEVQLAAGEAAPKAPMKTEGGFLLAGRISDEAGDPVSGVHIAASLEGDNLGNAESGEDGAFEIAGLTAGEYALTVSARAHSRQRLENIPAGTRNLQIGLQPRGQIAGVVLGPDGPVQNFEVGATIGVTDQHEVNYDYTTFSDRDGRFTLTGVDAGEVTIAAHAPGLVPAIMTIQGVSAAHPIAGITLRLQQAGAIAGSVVDKEGTPIREARIVATIEGRHRHSEVFTDTGGAFNFHELPPGPLRFSVQHPDYLHQSVEVKVSAGEPTTAAVTLLEGARLVGTVTHNGVPVRNATIEMPHHPRTVADLDRSDRGRTDAAGNFEITHIEPGTYRVEAQFRRGLNIITSPAQDVTLTNGETGRLEFELSPSNE